MDLADGLALIWAQAQLLYSNAQLMLGELNAVVAGGVGFVVAYSAALERQARDSDGPDSRADRPRIDNQSQD